MGESVRSIEIFVRALNPNLKTGHKLGKKRGLCSSTARREGGGDLRGLDIRDSHHERSSASIICPRRF